MFSKDTDNFTCRVRLALELPIKTRCAELTVLLDRGSLADLQALFPVLIDHIFGPQGAMSWGLRTTTDNNGEDFRQLMHFLSPVGPLFKLIYSLLKDPCAKYEFPVSYLPMKVRQVLENPQVHPFYSELITVNHQTKQVVSLLLNPFDYYIFHFAFHLINPCHQRGLGCLRNQWNTVYYCLSCDYILHFLPTEPGAQIIPLISYNGKNPFQTLPEIRRAPMTSKLINTSVLNKPIEDYSLLQNLDKHPRSEIWRSETLLTVFIDLWFNNDQINQNNQLNNGPYGAPYISNIFYYNELPSVEYMRIIRVFVKQIHSFSLSSKADQSHMGELKKIALPMLHAKFYIFLRNVIHRSPLDGSFRLVLELWLTYIQPWRYTPSVNSVNKMGRRDENPDIEDAAPMKSVELEFLPFIAENLLAFVVIFQQLLPRFARVDLVSPKMAVMLYRITKVFNQPNLTTYLREIEQCVENNHSPSHTYNSHWSNSLPPLSPTSSWSTNVSPNVSFSQGSASFSPEVKSNFVGQQHVPGDRKWSVIVRQKIYELEGPNFFYKPLFSSPPAQEVYDLVYLIKRSIVVAKEMVDCKKQEETQRYSGFFGLLKSVFDTPVLNDEFTLQDRMKVPTYLECSLQNLMDIFGITEVKERESEIITNSSLGSNLEVSDDFKFLTPQIVRERMKTIKYEGDPDLLPIQSNEVKVLVRALYQVATKLNEDCRAKFHQLYYQNNYIGRIFRQILQPPQTIYRYNKTLPGSPRVSTTLPPRISLRYFANYSFLSYFTIGFLISYYFFNMSLPSYVFMLILLYFSYICLKAIPRKTVGHSYPTQGFGNISFNDSF